MLTRPRPAAPPRSDRAPCGLSLRAAALAAVLLAAGCPEPTPAPTPTPTAVVDGTDSDGDGWTVAQGDCNDHAPAVNPAAQEACDGADRDEDCNGLSDNADPNADPTTQTLYHHDVDHDGFGDAASARPRCDDPTSGDDWWTTDASDCNDRDPDRAPGRPEVCDGVDQDCDGVVDEGTSCASPTPDDAPPRPTPTPTPTARDLTPTPRPPIEPRTPRPTPTPVPLPDELHHGFTRFAVAPEDEGLDYDGNGTKDNGIYEAMEIIQVALVEAVSRFIDDQTDFPDQTDPCESQEAGCAFTPVTAAAAKLTAAEAIEQTVSVERLNQALAEAFEVTNTPWALQIEDARATDLLTYYAGSVELVGGAYVFVADALIGVQDGHLDRFGGVSTFGPGTFVLSASLGEADGEPMVVSFDIHGALTQMVFSPEAIDGALTGGGITIVALADLVEEFLAALEEVDALPEDFDEDATVDAVEDALLNASDIHCPDTGEPCFSVTFVYDTVKILDFVPPAARRR